MPGEVATPAAGTHGGCRGGGSTPQQPRSASRRLHRGSFLTSLLYPVIVPTQCRPGRLTWAVSSGAYRPPQGLPPDYAPAYQPPREIVPLNDPSPSFPRQTTANPRTRGSSAKNLSSWLGKGNFLPSHRCCPHRLVCRVWGGHPQAPTTFLQLALFFSGVHWEGFFEVRGCLWCLHIRPQGGLGLRQKPFARLTRSPRSPP